MKSQTDVCLQIMQSLSQLLQGDQTRDTDGGGCSQTSGHTSKAGGHSKGPKAV